MFLHAPLLPQLLIASVSVTVNAISSSPKGLAARLYLRGNGISIEENECLASWNV